MQAGGYGSQSRVAGSASAISKIVVVLAGSRRAATAANGERTSDLRIGEAGRDRIGNR
jgi:hypothetical protein